MGIYDDMAKEIDQLRTEVQELRNEQQYIRDLASNSYLSAAQKWVMWAVREKLGRVAKENEQLSEVSIRDLASNIGMSKDRVGEIVQSLATTGAIARKQIYDVTEGYKGKVYRKHILLGLTLFSANPKEISPLTPRNHGGKRQQCEKCGGENLEVYEAYICKDCGHIHHAELKKETKGRHSFGQSVSHKEE